MKITDKRTGAQTLGDAKFGSLIEAKGGDLYMLCIDTEKTPSESFLVRVSDGQRAAAPAPETVVRLVNGKVVLED